MPKKWCLKCQKQPLSFIKWTPVVKRWSVTLINIYHMVLLNLSCFFLQKISNRFQQAWLPLTFKKVWSKIIQNRRLASGSFRPKRREFWVQLNSTRKFRLPRNPNLQIGPHFGVKKKLSLFKVTKTYKPYLWLLINLFA